MPKKLGNAKKYIAARVEPSLVSALQAIADKERRSFSFMVEEAMREYVQQRESKPPRK